ncbi:MAG: hypothetical protein H7Y86_13250 [Rhizobacter sp.]|nr:hypothetical protein [Ferruginibacter sp.]
MDQCLLSVIQNIGEAGHKTYILRTYSDQQFNATGTLKKYKVKYVSNTLLIGNNGQPVPAQTNVTILADGTNQVEIALNPTFFQTTTKEWVSAVILHELAHGIVSIEKPALNTNLMQHTFMFDERFPISIAQSLTELFPGIDQHDAIALGIDGLSEGYTIPGTNTINPAKNTFAEEKYFQNLNQAITAANRNAIAGYGTVFC